jgi:uncharacterized protein
MATTYKTPGVYVEEISKLPPSIAQVETAIPAFIGYTEMAKHLAAGDLHKVPKRIGSLVEYELYYGGGPSPNVTEVNISDTNVFVSAKVNNKYFMYDSLRMFYSNGGGDCYIVSVGDYDDTIDKPAFDAGLDVIAKESVPTILLFPDAVALDDDKLGALQIAALKQCFDLQDRVTVMDVKENDPLGGTFRNKVGVLNLNYGAAYTPWLKVNLPKNVTYKDISKTGVLKRANVDVTLSGLTGDPTIQAAITDLGNAYVDVAKIDTQTKVLSPANGNLRDKFNALVAAFNTTPSTPQAPKVAALKDVFDYYYKIAAQVDKYIKTGHADVLLVASSKAALETGVSGGFNPIYVKVVGLEKETSTAITGGAYTVIDTTTVFTHATVWTGVTAAAPTTLLASAANNTERIQLSFNALLPIFEEINQSYLGLVVEAANKQTKTKDEVLQLTFPLYKSILAGVANSMTTMPPSGAVVGVYAATDSARGVWKAPANVSLTNVVAPAATFTRKELDDLNVDAVAGKSINAIRTFTGRGTLVYGARTLAGNDNEWRYISVRRFFNMVEESSKNATEAFVFEPNDANTWVKVQGMIENFLTTLWRQGALQGEKPEHAFYVAVGLGKTMTSLDILEGRMIVEIGMAVVRPAEFIILRFSHKMAES